MLLLHVSIWLKCLLVGMDFSVEFVSVRFWCSFGAHVHIANKIATLFKLVQALAFKMTHNRFIYTAHSGDVPFQLVSPYYLLYFQFIHFIFWFDLVLYDGLHVRKCAQSIMLFFKLYLKLNHIYVHSLSHTPIFWPNSLANRKFQIFSYQMLLLLIHNFSI